MATSNVTFERVESPTESLAEEATQVFAGLMVADPAAIALVGGDMSLLPSLGGVMLRALALTPGIADLFIARDETGALVGYTLFSLPGQLILSTPEQQKHGLFEFMGKLSPEGQKYYPDVMAKEVPKANDEALGIAEAERNTYWCNFAMVREDYQGKGVAKALFELATKEAAKTGVTMALTTTNIRNVPIYEKLGFTLCGHKVMPSPWVDWPLWFFKKETAVPATEAEA
ncbi:uncharacterized protein TRAVEDRAFT_53118 [Trametes versicolor FP-101664 SS1]|uniref:uncharacterized protein n=1 Tax=Trametes versicolor (strain FP-101664) TaxID=717944 RepID=UPI000462468A|nr:uncharacterized protein TRAVEDRAFT_53118 [Trametes versicolor FP-101664 SS1]EIW52676.1 hypothetical protein TRAVEDRAFT_53118 [Trametes versicolor FP-101664 SS1]